MRRLTKILAVTIALLTLSTACILINQEPSDTPEIEEPEAPTITPTLEEPTVTQIGDWILAWNDEFSQAEEPDENGLDMAKWDYQYGNGSQYGVTDWGNNERQYYRKENVRVEDGQLVITALAEKIGGKAYTSARIRTSGKFKTTYGRIEAKMLLPEGEGLWPAFWMMAEEPSVYGTWAASGEIDIMEARGRLPGEVSGAIHYGGQWPDNTYNSETYKFPEGVSFSDDFHVYALEWEPGELRWYVDDVLYCTMNDWYSRGEGRTTDYPYPAPFDQPFHLLLNLAVGGNFDNGKIPGEGDLPAEMRVDYVRVYQKENYTPATKPEIDIDPLFTDAKQADETGNYILDPYFDSIISNPPAQPDNWYFMTGGNNSGGTAQPEKSEFDGQNGVMVTIESSGSQDYAIQLMQTVPLCKGRYYKVSFDAKSDGKRDIHAKISTGGANDFWKDYTPNFTASLTEQLEYYEFIFQMKDTSHAEARLELNLGLSTYTVYIANVRVEEIDKPDA